MGQEALGGRNGGPHRPRIAEIRRRYEAGHTLKEIAVAVGASESTVFRWLRDAGVPRRRRGAQPGRSFNAPPLTDAVLRQTQELYIDHGLSMKQIADVLGLCHQTVRERLIKAGVERRTLAEAQALRQGVRREN